MTWHPIPNYPGYEINADGSVRSHKRGRPRIRALQISDKGYYRVQLHCDGARRWEPVHILVAEVFHGPRPVGLVIRHLDGDKLNNSAENLRYGTSAENVADQVSHGTHWQVQKTHCPAGHPYDERNTYQAGERQHRKCRPCTNAASARYQARKRAAA